MQAGVAHVTIRAQRNGGLRATCHWYRNKQVTNKEGSGKGSPWNELRSKPQADEELLERKVHRRSQAPNDKSNSFTHLFHAAI